MYTYNYETEFIDIISSHLLKGRDKTNNNSVYKYSKNIYVPRVNSVMDLTINTPGIPNWANYLGFRHKSYTKTLQEAANIGTAVHSNISSYILENKDMNNTQQEIVNCYNSFKMWWDNLNKNNTIEVIGAEKTIISPYFGGTYDLLLKVNGRVRLIDFKTSNHIHFRYFIQLAAYRWLIRFAYNYDVDSLTILRLDKYDYNFEELTADMHCLEDKILIENCSNTFFSLLSSYFQLKKVKESYDSFYNRRKK